MTPAGIEPATTFSRNVLAAFVFGLPCIPVMNLGITFCAFNAKTCSISYEYLMFSRYWLLRIAVSWVMKTYRRLHCFVVLHKTTVGIDLFFYYFISSFHSLPSQLTCHRRAEDDVPHSLPACLEFLTSSCWRTPRQISSSLALEHVRCANRKERLYTFPLFSWYTG